MATATLIQECMLGTLTGYCASVTPHPPEAGLSLHHQAFPAFKEALAISRHRPDSPNHPPSSPRVSCRASQGDISALQLQQCSRDASAAQQASPASWMKPGAGSQALPHSPLSRTSLVTHSTQGDRKPRLQPHSAWYLF